MATDLLKHKETIAREEGDSGAKEMISKEEVLDATDSSTPSRKN